MPHLRFRSFAALTGLILSLVAVPAYAQWSPTVIGVTEYDTNETLLLLAGVSAQMAGAGWSPVVGLQGYTLSYKSGTTTTHATSIRPFAGVAHAITGGSFQVTGGYAFTNQSAPPTVAVATADRGDGFVLTSSLDYWGTGGPYGYQLLGDYNFGSSSLWTRGRVSTRLSQTNDRGGQVRLGGEVAYMNGGGFSVWQPGAVLEWHAGGGPIVGFGIGEKFPNQGDNATYFKLEAVLPLGRH